MKSTKLHSNDFIQFLIDKEIVPEDTFHVVIDCRIGNIAVIHYSVYGEDAIEVIMQRGGIDILGEAK